MRTKKNNNIQPTQEAIFKDNKGFSDNMIKFMTMIKQHGNVSGELSGLINEMKEQYAKRGLRLNTSCSSCLRSCLENLTNDYFS